VRGLALVVGAVLLLGVGLGVVLLGGDEDAGDRAEAIAEDPGEFLGQRVTVTGEVESFFPGAFTLGDSTWGEELLVVPAEGVELPRVIRMREARPDVEVRGEVQRAGEGIELVGGEEFDPYEGEGVIRATRIEVVE
jgi:hypothetical protein